MTNQVTANAKRLPQILFTIRLMSVGLILIGIALFLNLGDIGGMMNLKEHELHKTIGLMVIAMGAVDYYFIPKVLVKRLPKE